MAWLTTNPCPVIRRRRNARAGTWRARVVTTLACAALLPIASAAAQRGASAPPSRWIVRESATLDLWYHGLATVGFESPGPLPYYAPGYAAALRRARAAAGIGPTPLERDADELRAVFQGDSAFEVLHFLPLYFATDDPPAFLAIVRALAGGTPTGALPPAQRAVLEALRTVVGSRAERAALGRFARDLDAEWREVYADWLARSRAARAEAEAALQARWDGEVAPPLAGMLAGAGLARGTIFLVPAMGAEGRIVANTQGDGTSVAVWSPPFAAPDDAPLLAAVRELCFPVVVERLPIAAAAHGNRAAASGESSRAAVRCGARLLDATAPALAAAYRDAFRRAAASAPRSGGGMMGRSFDESFRLAPATERALDAETKRLLASRASAPR